MSNTEVIASDPNNEEEKEPESSSRMISSRELADSQNNQENKKDKKNKKLIKEESKFIIEEEYLPLDECTALTLGPEKIIQKCFACQLCDNKKDHFICKFCYYKCHEKCRKISKVDPKQEDFKGEKEFACYCGNKLKHKIEMPQKKS